MNKYTTFIILIWACVNYAQKNFVKLEVNQKKITVGSDLVITVRANVEGEITINFPAEFIRGYEVFSGMEQEVDYNSGMVNTISYYAQNGSFKKSGTFTIGPAYVKRGKNIYKSNTVEVSVQKESVDNTNGSVSAKQLSQLAFGVIEVNKSDIFEGEPLIVQAKVYSKFAPTSIEDYQSYKIDQTLDKHVLENSQQLTAKKETLKGVSLFAIKHDRNLIFPSGSGILQINPFKLILKQHSDGMAIVSGGTHVNIKPLPDGAPQSFIGMVGDLSIDCNFNGECAAKGDILKMELVLTGSGNLHNIDPPNLKFSKGFILFGKPKITENYSFGAKGAEGKVIFEYTLQSTDNKPKTIKDQNISYFDPAKAKYITLKLKGYQTKGSEPQTVSHKGTTTIVKNNENSKIPSKKEQNGSVPWFAISTSLLVLLGFIGFYAFRKKVSTATQLETVKAPVISSETWEDLENQRVNIKSNAMATLMIKALNLKYFGTTLNLDKSTLFNHLSQENTELHTEIQSFISKVHESEYGLNLSASDQADIQTEFDRIYTKIQQII